MNWFEELSIAKKLIVWAVGLFMIGISSGVTVAGVAGWPERIEANAAATAANAASILQLKQDVEMILIAQALDICERRNNIDNPPAGSLQTCIVATRREVRELQRVTP